MYALLAPFNSAAMILFQAAQVDTNQMTADQKFELAREAAKHGQMTGWLVPIAFFALIAVIVWLGVRRKQAQIQAQAQLRKQLLDKFTSGQELTAFLESKGGRQFLEDLQWQGNGRLRFIPAGVVTTMLGLAFLGLSLREKNYTVAGVVLLAIGIGLLISAAIVHKLAPEGTDQTISPDSGIQSLPPA